MQPLNLYAIVVSLFLPSLLNIHAKILHKVGVVGLLTECGDLESEKFEACWAPLLNGERACI